MINKVYLCAICNIQSGTCSEDCKFCTQSVKYKAKIQRYKNKPIQEIIKEAKIARANKAVGYCLVTAGLGLDDNKIEFLCNIAYELQKEVPDLNLIGCNGIATIEQLKELKKAGIMNYNHNLETSKEYYHNICSTHDWDSRYQTCLNVNKVGLGLLSGGIFGMGESYEDRISMLKSLKSLNPKTTPLNFFIPNDALPITSNSLTIQEAFDMIKISREILGDDVRLMVAGGREYIFKDRQYEIFHYGANSIVIGNYLTTNGKTASKDLEELTKLGIEPIKFL